MEVSVKFRFQLRSWAGGEISTPGIDLDRQIVRSPSPVPKSHKGSSDVLCKIAFGEIQQRRYSFPRVIATRSSGSGRLQFKQTTESAPRVVPRHFKLLT